MVEGLCIHNMKGFCKFGEHCRNRHVDEICGNPQCGEDQEQKCERRHPRPCKFFSIYDFCKFGESCAYLHKVKKDEAFMDLENRVAAAEERIRDLENLIKQMKDDRILESDEEYDINEDDTADGDDENDITVIETASGDASSENFNCELCDFTSTRKNGLAVHMGCKHGTIVQPDGANDDLIDEDSEGSAEMARDFMEWTDCGFLVECTECDFVAEDWEHFKKHLIGDHFKKHFMRDHKPGDLWCAECNMRGGTVDDMRRHKSLYHPF